VQINSLAFILFGLIVFLIWPLVRRRNNVRWGFLVVASYFFYGWWDWRFLFLITFSGLIDYLAALGMVRWPRRRTAMLVASVIGNVGALALFKYAGFFIRNVNWIAEHAVAGINWLLAHTVGGAVALPVPTGGVLPWLTVILPVGISFYTFQSMSYTIDVYRGRLTPTRNPLHFFAYLAMFPQLVAGPIVRASDLLPQLRTSRATTADDRWEAIRLIVAGYFKKVVVADTVAGSVVAAFSAGAPLESCAYWWVVMGLFAFQIYCDFSGYSDIARGLARWMGYDFPLNFNHPYISRSFREFWGRWHISLSTWFRDYVYVPLGGSRCSGLRSHLNLWITMVVSGLWHGAAWTFVAWGALHAALLSAERITRWPERLGRGRIGRHASVLIVFLLTLVTWALFRAHSFSQAASIIATMFSFHRLNLQAIPDHIHVKSVLVVALMALRQLWVYAGLDVSRLARGPMADVVRVVGVALMVVACVFLRGPGTTFIYFQF